MVQLDYTKIIESAAAQVSDKLPKRGHIPEEKSRQLKYIIRSRTYLQGDESPRTFNEIKKDLYGSVWTQVLNEAVKANAGSELDGGNLGAEWVVLALKRKDTVRGEIKFRKGHFIVPLANCKYRIYKKPEGSAALPETLLDRLQQTVTIEPYVFADLIAEFDGHIPEMTKKADEVYQEHKAEMFEIQKEKRAAEIRKRTVEALMEQFLKPQGIEMTYRFIEDGTKVKLDMHKTLELHLDLPVEQLAATLRDTESLLSQMK